MGTRWELPFILFLKNSKSKPIFPLFLNYQPGPIPLPKRVGTYLDFTSFSLGFIKKEEPISPTHERVIVQVVYNPQNWGVHLFKTPPQFPPLPTHKKTPPKKMKKKVRGGLTASCPHQRRSVSQPVSQAPRQTEFDGVRVREGKKILVAIVPLWCFRFPGTFRSTLGNVEIPFYCPEFFTIHRTNFFSLFSFFSFVCPRVCFEFGSDVVSLVFVCCILEFFVFFRPSFLPLWFSGIWKEFWFFFPLLWRNSKPIFSG